MKKIITLIVVGLMFVLALGLTACGASADATSQQEAIPSSDASDSATAQNLLTIGTASDGGISVTATNDTGKIITGLSLKKCKTSNQAADKTFGASLLTDGAKWENGVTANIQFPAGAENAKPTFDILLSFDDKTKLTLHSVKLDGMTGATISIDKKTKLAYVQYNSESGEKKSTLSAEKKLKAKEDAAAAAKKIAEKAAKKLAESSSGNSTSNPAKSQITDSCIDDPILR